MSFGLPSAIFWPVIEHHDVFRHRHDGAHQMLDDDDGEAATRELADQCDGLIDLRRVKPRHDLIQQKKLWLCRQGARHFEPALVDRGEVARGEILAGREPDEVDGFARLLARHLGASVAQERACHHIGQNRHAAERLGDLKRPREAKRADGMRAQAHDLLTKSRHRACIRPVEAHDQVERGGLAGAVGADQRQRLVLAHGEADVLHGPQTAEPFVEIFDDERVGHGVTSAQAKRAIWRGGAPELPRGSP